METRVSGTSPSESMHQRTRGGPASPKRMDLGEINQMIVEVFSIQELIPPTDNPHLFEQDDPKHTCQVTYSLVVTRDKFSCPSYILVRSSLHDPVQPFTDRYSTPRPGPVGDVCWDCESVGCSHTVRKLDTGVQVMKRYASVSKIETWNPPRVRSTPTGYEGRLTFVRVSYRISELFYRQVFASFSMN